MMQVERRTIEKLLWKLQNGNNMVQLQAAQSLGALRDARAIVPLIAALHSGRKPLQVQAAQALASIGPAAVMPLIQVLREDESQVWMLASAALFKIGKPVVEPLLKALPGEAASVQILLVEILGQIGDVRAADALIEALHSPSDGLRAAAAIALARLGAPGVKPLLSALSRFQQPDFQRHAADVVRVIGQPAIRELLLLMAEGSEPERSQAAWLLGRIGAPAVPGLLRMLEANHVPVRYAAAWALGKTGSHAAVPALVRHLNDEDKLPSTGMRVCDVAAWALEVIATPEAAAAARAWRELQADNR